MLKNDNGEGKPCICGCSCVTTGTTQNNCGGMCTKKK